MTQNHYKRTTISCFVGIFSQAIMTNLVAILFIPMMRLYGFNYAQLGMLVGINFLSQVSADVIFSGLIDKIGYKKMVLPTTICSFLGLVLLGFSPYIFPNNIFLGIIISTIIFAFSSGLLEILLSPIISSMPNDDKGPAMSLMHSFYAWGQALTIALTTIMIFVFSDSSWNLIAFIWAIVPLTNFFMFLGASFPEIIPEGTRQDFKDLILKPFYLFALGAIFFGGASEIVMNQWSSTFMENGLGLDKITGDLVGMCGFALLMGVGRTVYGLWGAKMNIYNILIINSLLTAVCYIVTALSPINALNILACVVCGFTASLLWPGTIVVAADKFPLAGAWMFAILAAAGDIGGSVAPWITGLIVNNSIDNPIAIFFSSLLEIGTEQSAIRIGLLFASIFPIGAFLCHIGMKKLRGK